jgi:hypothetical protein
MENLGARYPQNRNFGFAQHDRSCRAEIGNMLLFRNITLLSVSDDCELARFTRSQALLGNGRPEALLPNSPQANIEVRAGSRASAVASPSGAWERVEADGSGDPSYGSEAIRELDHFSDAINRDVVGDHRDSSYDSATTVAG